MAVEEYAHGSSIWADVVAENLPEITERLSLSWSTWSGRWAVLPKAGGSAVLSGGLIRTDTVGTFQMKIGASLVTPEAVPEGSYIIVCQADNAIADFSKEFAKVEIDVIAAKIP